MTVTEVLKPDAAPEPRDSVIQARGLTRYFGRKCAVDSVTFNVPRGSVFAFIGRNGAGKTTTIRMILGLLEPTRGSAGILGYDSVALPPEARAGIGYMAEGHPVYGWMRVGQYAGFQRSFYDHWNQETFAAVIDYFAIDPRTKSGHLSHGERAGLHLAMTLAIEPEVLMLDDPATGLDPSARRSLLEAMIYFTRSRERTISFRRTCWMTWSASPIMSRCWTTAFCEFAVAPTRSGSAFAESWRVSLGSRHASCPPSPACCGRRDPKTNLHSSSPTPPAGRSATLKHWAHWRWMNNPSAWKTP
jgi:ABC-type Na+ transport system ATPase subunit NatA